MPYVAVSIKPEDFHALMFEGAVITDSKIPENAKLHRIEVHKQTIFPDLIWIFYEVEEEIESNHKQFFISNEGRKFTSGIPTVYVEVSVSKHSKQINDSEESFIK